MTPQQFIAKWKPAQLSERSACQQHFLDLCDLLHQPKPAEVDPTGDWYTFEKGVAKNDGGKGFADVWMQGKFGWEYKGKHKNLAAAYQQLLKYREALENPPLLVVCDLDRFEVHTNFTGTAKRVHKWDLDGLADPANVQILRHVFTNPDALRPDKTREAVTKEVADRFGRLADGLTARGVPPQAGAHFLMKLMFCMFAEDVELLPRDLFARTVSNARHDPARLSKLLGNLFESMAKGEPFGADDIFWFNGGLFADADTVDLTPGEIDELLRAARCDWSDVEPDIFGTLFQRILDPAKRAQTGAHYTKREDIETLLRPVLIAPLQREWAETRAKADKLWEKVQAEARKQTGKTKKGSRARREFDRCLAEFDELAPHYGAGPGVRLGQLPVRRHPPAARP
jgi:type II restriction/modification system DNA methylase subunit YeeA